MGSERENRQKPKGERRALKQAERSALSDRRLTEAAIELLVKHGINGTTLQAVGERAGYSRALATHRFGSKAGLFANVLKSASADWLERVKDAVGSRVGVDALCAATDAAERFVNEQPDEVKAMYLLWFLGIDPSANYTSNLASVHKAQRRDVARWIVAGQEAGLVVADADPDRVAEQYAASMAGIIYQWLANPAVPLHDAFVQLKQDLTVRLSAGSSATAAKRTGKSGTRRRRRQTGRA